MSRVRVTVRSAAVDPGFAADVAGYRELGWGVVDTPTGLAVASPAVCGVEMHGEPVADLLRLMYRQRVRWPTLDVPGNQRLVILAAAPADHDYRAVLAARAMPRRAGSPIPLPPTVLAAGPVRWVIPPGAAELPVLDAVVTAIRTATDWRHSAAPRAAS